MYNVVASDVLEKNNDPVYKLKMEKMQPVLINVLIRSVTAETEGKEFWKSINIGRVSWLVRYVNFTLLQNL